VIRRRNRRSFSVRRVPNVLATYEQTKVTLMPRMLKAPNFLVGSLCDVVSSCQVWFGFVHFCQRYGGKTLPEDARLIT